MPVDQRLCESCNVVEDECHVIMHCSLYDDIHVRTHTHTLISDFHNFIFTVRILDCVCITFDIRLIP